MKTTFTQTLFFKIFTIGILMLFLIIPMGSIKSLIYERENRKNNVIDEVQSKWGSDQTIFGPIITIPYKTFVEQKITENNKTVIKVIEQRKNAYFLPKTFQVFGDIETQTRSRGMYDAILYNSQLKFNGIFNLDFNKIQAKKEHIYLDEALILFGITDKRGIKENIHLSWQNENQTFDPFIKDEYFLDSGVSSQVALDSENSEYSYDFNLHINGSKQLNIIPVGEQTNIKLSSNWASPSFNGAFLPETREINKQGFTAQWKVLDFNKNYPHYWIDNNSQLIHQMTTSKLGVELFTSVDNYQKMNRAVKYNILFIFLTFLVFFLIEIMQTKKLHYMQYLLVGFAITLFYLLLLSISEHLIFSIAYSISSMSTAIVITAYSWSILKYCEISKDYA